MLAVFPENPFKKADCIMARTKEVFDGNHQLNNKAKKKTHGRVDFLEKPVE